MCVFGCSGVLACIAAMRSAIDPLFWGVSPSAFIAEEEEEDGGDAVAAGCGGVLKAAILSAMDPLLTGVVSLPSSPFGAEEEEEEGVVVALLFAAAMRSPMDSRLFSELLSAGVGVAFSAGVSAGGV